PTSEVLELDNATTRHRAAAAASASMARGASWRYFREQHTPGTTRETGRRPYARCNRGSTRNLPDTHTYRPLRAQVRALPKRSIAQAPSRLEPQPTALSDRWPSQV